MTRPRRWVRLAVLASGVATSGCSEMFGLGSHVCLEHMEHSFTVEVRDQVSGAPAAFGVTGVSVHDSGERTEFIAGDELRLMGNWHSELRGRHTIFLQKPGFVAAPVRTIVFADECHVKPRTVQARIGPDPQASPVDPVSFVEGAVINAWEPSATVQVHGDTLEISGWSYPGCNGFRAVAYRSGPGMHVQVEASDPVGACASQHLFEARYLLPPGQTHLLVTTTIDFPAVLFVGEVQPS